MIKIESGMLRFYDADPDLPLTTIDSIDLPRYLGKWYEIAYIPSSFEPAGTTDTTAEYSLNEDGSIKVVNTSYYEGRKIEAKGRAVPTDIPGRFIVKFYPSQPDIPNYYILDLDSNYQYSMVGSPSFDTLWILAREPFLTKDVIVKLLTKAGRMGYETKSVIIK